MSDSSESEKKIILQKCSKCSSTSFRPYHLLSEGHHDRVYLECTECGHFNTRLIVYTLVDPDFHESAFYMRSISSNSSRETLKNWEEHRLHAEDQFRFIKEVQSQSGIDLKDPDEIRELYQEMHITENR